MEIDVSIIIINYNTFAYTCRCIDHVYLHTKDVSFEIVLVDNASTERSASDFLELYPNIKLVVSEENLGFAKGNNLGISKASGNNILLLNSDAFLLNNAVRVSLDSLKDKDVAVVSCRLENQDLTPQFSCQRFPSVRVILFELFRLQKVFPARIYQKILLGSFFKYDQAITVDWTWGTFFMFPVTLLHSFPENKLQDDFFMYAEDLYWCKYIQQLGKKIVFNPKGRVLHLMGGSSGPKSEMMLKNEKIFMEHFYKPLDLRLIRLFSEILQKTTSS